MEVVGYIVLNTISFVVSASITLWVVYSIISLKREVNRLHLIVATRAQSTYEYKTVRTQPRIKDGKFAKKKGK